MIELFQLILGVLASLFKSRATLEAENLVLRQQVNVLRRQVSKRPQLNNADRFSVGLALSLVPFPSWGDCDRQAGDDHPLASRGVPGVLALAVTQSGWQTEDLGRVA
jgi:hypothetical protein